MDSLASSGLDGSEGVRDGASPQFQRDLVALIPFLRAKSRAMCRNRAMADDMAQEALAKAWRSRDRFETGTNLQGWLFTILRNEIHSQRRRTRRETSWDPRLGELIPVPAFEQEWSIGLSDAARALRKLPDRQRTALLLVAAGGFTYKDAADICHMPQGTVKSRVARARAALLRLLESKSLPQRSNLRAVDASDDILAQLAVLSQQGADGAHIHA